MSPLARDERRWKLNLCQECRNPFGHKPDCSTLDRWALPYPVDPVEVMPVSEHEALREAAQALFNAIDVSEPRDPICRCYTLADALGVVLEKP